MKCPMLTMYAVTLHKPEEFQDRDCLEQDCAWWINPKDEDNGKCAIKLLALSADDLASDVEIIKLGR